MIAYVGVQNSNLGQRDREEVQSGRRSARSSRKKETDRVRQSYRREETGSGSVAVSRREAEVGRTPDDGLLYGCSRQVRPGFPALDGGELLGSNGSERLSVGRG